MSLKVFEFVYDLYFENRIKEDVQLKSELDVERIIENGITNDPLKRSLLHYLSMSRNHFELLKNQKPEQWLTLDLFEKTPLHYLIESLDTSSVVLSSDVTASLVLSTLVPLETWTTKDKCGVTPLHLLIAKGEKVEYLLSQVSMNTKEWERCIDLLIQHGRIQSMIEASKKSEMIQSLLSTALFKSLYWGFTDSALLLLESSVVKDINIRYKFQQTPLILAGKLGNESIVAKILELGAEINAVDQFDMSCFDYAVYHGHNAIASILKSQPDYKPRPCTHSISNSIFGQPQKRNIVESGYLIEFHIGTRDKRKPNIPFRVLQDQPYHSIKVTVQNGRTVSFHHNTHELFDDNVVILLPIDRISDSFYVYAEKLEDCIVYFDLRGCGTARASLMLDAPVTSLWQEKNPLGGRIRVPFVGSDHDTVATMTIEYTVVKAHPNKYVSEGISCSSTAWVREDVALVGHRGLGMNRTVVKDGQPRLQLGENTIVSLTKGGELGAHYVEFDVQLTRDLVPVLYHDFVTSEWESDIPVSMISSQQLKDKKKVSRSNSHSAIDGMKIGSGVMKPNGAGTIQSPFATLEEALKIVPLKCGFNIEIKYPNLEEAEHDNLHNAEINLFCDRILDTIALYGQKRDILFSSFHPEICFLMCFRQNQYPVFFLTDGGALETYDVRLNSLDSAVTFCKEIGCHGIVTNCKPLVETLHVIPYIRNQGLRIYSYGGMNNQVEFALDQVKAGIDGVIVDDVKEVKIAISGL